MPYKDPEKLKQYQRRYRELHKEKLLAKTNAWRRENIVKVCIRRRELDSLNPERSKRHRAKYAKKVDHAVAYAKRKAASHIKLLARGAVCRAIRRGDLCRSECVRCGSTEDLQMHHTNGYARENWLAVECVCRKCHRKDNIKY